jgi:hypothetical protein
MSSDKAAHATKDTERLGVRLDVDGDGDADCGTGSIADMAPQVFE